MAVLTGSAAFAGSFVEAGAGVTTGAVFVSKTGAAGESVVLTLVSSFLEVGAGAGSVTSFFGSAFFFSYSASIAVLTSPSLEKNSFSSLISLMSYILLPSLYIKL